MSTDTLPADNTGGPTEGIDPLDVLEFREKTGKRATHEALALTPGKGYVEVANESHAEGDAHTYRVDLQGGIPFACTCPADEYHAGACKHRVRVALSPAVIDAAEGGR